MGYKLGTVRYEPAAGGSVYKVTQPNGSVIDMPAAKLTDFIYEKAKHMKSGTRAAMANQTNDSFTVQLRWNGMGAPQHRVAFKTLAEAEKEAERLHRLYGSLGNPEFPTMKGIVEIEVHDTKQPWKNRTVRWFASRAGAKARLVL